MGGQAALDGAAASLLTTVYRNKRGCNSIGGTLGGSQCLDSKAETGVLAEL